MIYDIIVVPPGEKGTG